MSLDNPINRCSLVKVLLRIDIIENSQTDSVQSQRGNCADLMKVQVLKATKRAHP